MNVGDIVIIISTLIFWRLALFALFGYFSMPIQVHSTYDIYGNAYSERMLWFDKKFFSRWTLPIALTAFAFLLLPWNPWPVIDPKQILFPLVIIPAFCIAWWCLTRATGKSRLGLGFLFFMLLWHPAFLPLFLFLAVSSLRAWEHHMQMPLRVLLTIFISLIVFGLGDCISELSDMPWPSNPIAATFTLVLLCVSQHYFIPGLRKLTLGKHPWSWALNNQLHQLCRSAYAYGWLRFINEKTFLKATRMLKKANISLQISVVLFEVLFGFALFSRELAALLLFIAACFHIGYFLFTGALFWQNILLLTALFVGVQQVPSEIFNPFIVALSLTITIPLLRVWEVNKLGWWDTPFVNRLEWIATGVSGKKYTVPAEFFCPDDRIFALQKCGLHLCNEKIVTKHFGETPNEALAYTLIFTESELKQLPKIVDAYGVDQYSPSIRSMYIQYFKDFFLNFNEKGKKDPVPRWLKAPGTESHSLGRHKNFVGQEKVAEFEVLFLREYITDKKVMRVFEKPILKLNFQPYR